ncbi:serine/threonine-protein kinase [Streptomyces sp. NPDC017868]|uniref:serine/threonine-protein kinase n=1 Tax=Streptomyces sp. NPDC017868 TaxID=3365014 RepID=UPI0037A3E8B1
MQARGPNDPERVGPFRVIGVLGQGGMGRVLLGASASGQLVAVKQIHADLADDEGFRARFRREVDASRRVSGAYTAPVVDADADAPEPWLASLFLEGPTLSEAVAGGVLPEEAVRQLAAGLAQALADIHRVGLVHRDLKPSNIVLTADGVRVIDFGIARAGDQLTKLTHTGALVGSPAFMAPEQIRGETPGPAADVFALGSTLAVACTGRAPFHGDSVPALLYAVAHEAPDLAAVPPGLRGLIGACLAPDPGLRPSPRDLLALIGPVAPSARPWPEGVHRLIGERRAETERLRGSLGAAWTAPPPAQAGPPGPGGPVTEPAVRRPRDRRRRRWIAAGVAAGVLAVGGAVLAVTGLPDSVRYAIADEPVPTPGNVPLDKVADAYTGTVPSCREADPRLRVPAGFEQRLAQDGGPARTDPNGGQLTNQCVWNSRSGDEITVIWDLYRSKSGGPTGAEQAKKQHEGMYIRGATRRVFTLGFAEEALWYKPDGNRCVLYSRDVNLDLFVLVRGPRYPVGRCEALTESTTRQAIGLITKKAATP